MRIDVPAVDQWNLLCEQYRAALPFAANELALQVQIYAGYRQALWEVTRGISKLFPHKKTIALIQDDELVFDTLAQLFSAEGYTVKDLTAAEIEDSSTWLAEVQTELLFVLVSEDDPVTGRVYAREKLWEALNNKRVFRISLSHALHRFKPIERPGVFDVRVLSLDEERALLIAGERCRVTAEVASLEPWPVAQADEIQKSLRSFSTDDASRFKQAIEKFEKALPSGFKPYFQREEARLVDRTLFYHPEIDGSALLEELSRELGVSIDRAGADGRLETTSLCRWESPRFAQWLAKRGLPEEVVRGMVILDAALIAPGLSEKLQRAAAAVLKMQG